MDESQRKNIEGLVRFVGEHNTIVPKEAADALSIQEKDVLDVAKILESHNLAKTNYTLSGDVTIERGDRIKDASKEDLEKYIKEAINKEAEKEKERDTTAAEIIDELRMRIREKKYGQTTG